MFASFKDLMRLLEQSRDRLSTHGLQVAVLVVTGMTYSSSTAVCMYRRRNFQTNSRPKNNNSQTNQTKQNTCWFWGEKIAREKLSYKHTMEYREPTKAVITGSLPSLMSVRWRVINLRLCQRVRRSLDSYSLNRNPALLTLVSHSDGVMSLWSL